MKILCPLLLLTFVYENGNGKKLNVKKKVLGVLPSLKKTAENQTMQKYLAETWQMENMWTSQSGFVHQDIKVDMDSLPPPHFNVQLLGTVYFSLK